MSKEEYLKGEKKQAVLDLIRKYIAYRMTPEEMISNLKDKGHEISERTLRRYKLEIRENSGKNVSEIYGHEIIDNFIEDIFTIRELQREGWREYNKAKASHEKIKALSLVRNTTLDKYKLYGSIPVKYTIGQTLPRPYNILNDKPGEDKEDLKN